MLEDSITSSPSKSSKSIHDVRLLRRTKRKQIDYEKDKADLHTLFRDFYDDSDDESCVASNKPTDTTFVIANPTSIVSNFVPFQLEKSFLLADHINDECRKFKSLLSETQGFLSCQRLAENDVHSTADPRSKNTSFIITESELISCCNKAENVFVNASQKTPTKSLEYADLSLINSILEDFSQSPLKKSQITNHTTWQYTPEFRLRRIPVKTYSRNSLNKTRTNLSKDYFSKQSPLDLENESCSNCSSLSVQEDVAITNTLSSSSVSVSNSSQCLCENLLNLSAYFTHNDPCTPYYIGNLDITEQNTSIKSYNRTELLPLNRRQELLQQIHNLRADRKFSIESYNPLEDFCGFLNSTDSKADVVGDIKSNMNGELNQIMNSSIDISTNQSQNISINIEENDSLYNWNKDNYEEMFECINTEEIIQRQNEYEISKANNSSTKYVVETASSKPIQVSKQTHIIADNVLCRLSSITSKQKKTNLINCDISSVNEDVNLFENPKDYGWNEDCDVFLNFQTPIALEENPKSELQTKINKQTSITISPKILLSNENRVSTSASKVCNMGFTTGSGKNVLVSKKAQQSAQQLLNEFNNKKLAEDPNYNKLQELKNRIYKKTHNKNEEIAANTITAVKNNNAEHEMDGKPFVYESFKTANGKNIMVSSKAQESVKNLLNNLILETKDFNTDLLVIKQEITNKNLKFKSSNVSRINIVKDIEEEHQIGIVQDNNIIKKDQSKTMDSYEKYFCENNADLENLILSEWPFLDQNENFTSNVMESSSKETDSLKNDKAININIGFHTANGKKVPISAKAQQSVEKLLREIDIDIDATNVENNLGKIKTDILNKNKTLEKLNRDIEPLSSSPEKNVHGKLNESISSVLHQKPVEHNTNNKSIETNLYNLEKNCGFQTANGRNVSISAKGQKAVQPLLQELQTDFDFECYESNLKELKANIQHKQKAKGELKRFERQNCSEEIEEYANILLSEWPLKETELNTTLILKSGKRRHSINNGDITPTNTCLSPPAKIMNKIGSPNAKSSFAELTLKSPLTQAAQSVVSRKNLLSLTKRKKSKKHSLLNVNGEFTKLNQEIYAEKLSTVTPIKSINTLIDSERTPATPNLKEFLINAPHTSTPRTVDNLCNSPQTINESDFKPIKWNNNENIETSLTKSQPKISETSFSNITLNSSNPTAKERIGRLKMYGKAPDVSPILIETHNNCRPSGLRRTRSMLKRHEQN